MTKLVKFDLEPNDFDLLGEVLQEAILATPSGERRNRLTEINIRRMAAAENLFVPASDTDNLRQQFLAAWIELLGMYNLDTLASMYEEATLGVSLSESLLGANYYIVKNLLANKPPLEDLPEWLEIPQDASEITLDEVMDEFVMHTEAGVKLEPALELFERFHQLYSEWSKTRTESQ